MSTIHLYNDFVCAIYIDKSDILVTYGISIYTVHFAYILKALSFVDVDGTLPEVMLTILVYLFCGSFIGYIAFSLFLYFRSEAL